ncbi:hypothetical protein SSIN_0361 [Streptococcus sinensis]|uniref:Uncharacterized protein n=1 Tax=Streptococcus sinensis TaxID=176090 RepID=A0A0A0DIF6_9STRE|nr:hypothetical protein SSIN_0361 [Streptococcus sinensis]
MLPNWLVKYKKNGSTIIEKTEGERLKWDASQRKTGNK